MNYNHKVLAITADSEREVFQAVDCSTACAMAMERNQIPGAIVWIVERPNGERLCINDQRRVLETCSETNFFEFDERA